MTPVRGALLACLLLLAVGASAARVGDVAPGFALPDTMNGIVSLADYSGAPAVLVFYRGFF
jgi:peroxiredoxin